jgi:hypothetical protein
VYALTVLAVNAWEAGDAFAATCLLTQAQEAACDAADAKADAKAEKAAAGAPGPPGRRKQRTLEQRLKGQFGGGTLTRRDTERNLQAIQEATQAEQDAPPQGDRSHWTRRTEPQPAQRPTGRARPGVVMHKGRLLSGPVSVHHVLDLTEMIELDDPGGPVYAAADASWKGRAFGYGYITTSGHWGIHSGVHLKGSNGNDRAPSSVVHELRALAHLFDGVAFDPNRKVILLTDNADARDILRSWRSGNVDRLPRDEHLMRERDRPWESLATLAVRVAEIRRLDVPQVRAHTGHVLNELADSYSKLGRQHMEGIGFDVKQKGTDMALAFLRAWANTSPELREGTRGRVAGHRLPVPPVLPKAN